ncbi:hypothetical protein IPC367_27545 [Pseudomonas aeruginosa]|nr:hypothetical protein F3G58_06905 [Pseudomonas aeruginosa]KSS45808.2 hypothetical protein APB59_32560 [Pseudomonas aeruginosa]MDA1435671.1 hypothetical protein [Pseudomonas aeruginosa]OKR61895.1 hypothetical protein BH597_16000 [Pseudomonas aeruginosa]RPR21300.1 hypothetical protein IPC1060_08445 [Pseudomonas aeruginosa]
MRKRRLTHASLDASDEGTARMQQPDVDQVAEPIDEFSEVRAALQRIDADFIIYAGEIQHGHEIEMEALLAKIPDPASEVILWLSTPGGNPDAAYSIARLMQRKYRTFTVFVNGWCKSSGTLICLGASRVVMDDLGHLGPLDIQIINREEFGERHSGLNPIEALKSISYQSIELLRQQFLDIRFGGGLSTRQALEVATNLTGQLMSPITSQLDIMKYGEFTRSMRIATEYGNRLAKHHSNVRPDAISMLTTGYPSHGFVIDREEACERLFVNVEPPSVDLFMIATSLQTVVDKHLFGANNRALLVDLRHALKVPLARAVDESPTSGLNSQGIDSVVPMDEQQAPTPEQTTEAEVIPISGHEENEHGTHDHQDPSEEDVSRQSGTATD